MLGVSISINDHNDKAEKDSKISRLLAGVLAHNVIDAVVRSSANDLDHNSDSTISQHLQQLWYENLNEIGGIVLPSLLGNFCGHKNSNVFNHSKHPRIEEKVPPIGPVHSCYGRPAPFMSRPSLNFSPKSTGNNVYYDYVLKTDHRDFSVEHDTNFNSLPANNQYSTNITTSSVDNEPLIPNGPPPSQGSLVHIFIDNVDLFSAISGNLSKTVPARVIQYITSNQSKYKQSMGKAFQKKKKNNEIVHGIIVRYANGEEEAFTWPSKRIPASILKSSSLSTTQTSHITDSVQMIAPEVIETEDNYQLDDREGQEEVEWGELQDGPSAIDFSELDESLKLLDDADEGDVDLEADIAERGQEGGGQTEELKRSQNAFYGVRDLSWALRLSGHSATSPSPSLLPLIDPSTTQETSWVIGEANGGEWGVNAGVDRAGELEEAEMYFRTIGERGVKFVVAGSNNSTSGINDDGDAGRARPSQSDRSPYSSDDNTGECDDRVPVSMDPADDPEMPLPEADVILIGRCFKIRRYQYVWKFHMKHLYLRAHGQDYIVKQGIVDVDPTSIICPEQYRATGSRQSTNTNSTKSYFKRKRQKVESVVSCNQSSRI